MEHMARRSTKPGRTFLRDLFGIDSYQQPASTTWTLVLPCMQNVGMGAGHLCVPYADNAYYARRVCVFLTAEELPPHLIYRAMTFNMALSVLHLLRARRAGSPALP